MKPETLCTAAKSWILCFEWGFLTANMESLSLAFPQAWYPALSFTLYLSLNLELMLTTREREALPGNDSCSVYPMSFHTLPFLLGRAGQSLALTKVQHSLTHSPADTRGIHVRDTVVVFYNLWTDWLLELCCQESSTLHLKKEYW